MAVATRDLKSYCYDLFPGEIISSSVINPIMEFSTNYIKINSNIPHLAQPTLNLCT